MQLESLQGRCIMMARGTSHFVAKLAPGMVVVDVLDRSAVCCCYRWCPDAEHEGEDNAWEDASQLHCI